MVKNQESSELAQRVFRFIRQHRLVAAGSPLLVAVSGGADSVCLLHVLVELRDELGVSLHVAHLDHRLRGAEAEADARYVAGLSRRLGIPASIEQRDVKGYQVEHRLSLEEAAREVRYTFLAGVAKSIGADRVAVGHTEGDHIETILMHLVRGTGTRGLRGLQPEVTWQMGDDKLTVVRPLLSVTRDETVAYCREHRLEPRLDTSNLSRTPLRNRIRLELLPLLKGYNPGITESLLRTASTAADELDFLDREVAGVWDMVVSLEKDTIVLDKKKFRGLHPALQRHLLRSAMEKLLGNLRDIETRHIEEIMAALPKPAGKSINLPGGLVFAIEYERYLLGTDEAALSPFPPLEGEHPLKVPGETLIPGWRVRASIESIDEPDATPTATPLNFIATLDLDESGDELVVRTVRPGDRFQPMGMTEVKKIGEFMIDAKIPRAWRKRIPIVCSPERVLWVVGWRIDERVKVTDSTTRVLHLEFHRR
ncbi:MAG: tRNA lysidine(34) synthetase TilS [Chloroflexota bacterium]|nr:tRNA lysidine(34) synthetase TilS [Chloroflexota bacterium]